MGILGALLGSLLSNSLKPAVHPFVCPSVRQSHFWARSALALCRSYTLLYAVGHFLYSDTTTIRYRATVVCVEHKLHLCSEPLPYPLGYFCTLLVTSIHFGNTIIHPKPVYMVALTNTCCLLMHSGFF